MNVVVTYGDSVVVHTTTANMQRVLANNEVGVVKELAAVMWPRCRSVATRIKDVSYEVSR